MSRQSEKSYLAISSLDQMPLKPPWDTIENMEVVAMLYKKIEDLRSLSPTMPCLARSFSLHQEECQIASFWEDERLGKIAIVKNHPLRSEILKCFVLPD